MKSSRELYLKQTKDLEQIESLFTKYDSVNIVSKKETLDYKLVIEYIKNKNLDIKKFCFHFSLRNNSARSKLIKEQKIENFLQLQQNFNFRSLIVSGNPKSSIDSVEFLQMAKRGYPNLNFGVAFNPFSPGNALNFEKKRLKQKLLVGNVNSVWLQLGDSLEALKSSLSYIRDLSGEIVIWVSVLKINRKNLNSLAFRPWHGVLCSKEFLTSVSEADRINQKIMEIAQDNQCNILWGG